VKRAKLQAETIHRYDSAARRLPQIENDNEDEHDDAENNVALSESSRLSVKRAKPLARIVRAYALTPPRISPAVRQALDGMV
jgi:hypothetical protein